MDFTSGNDFESLDSKIDFSVVYVIDFNKSLLYFSIRLRQRQWKKYVASPQPLKSLWWEFIIVTSIFMQVSGKFNWQVLILGWHWLIFGIDGLIIGIPLFTFFKKIVCFDWKASDVVFFSKVNLVNLLRKGH